MATVQEPVRSPGRHETFVDAQIARASRRIRAQDVGAAALGLVIGTLVFALVMVLLDRWLDLPEGVRQTALVVYLLSAGLYAAVVVSRPFRRQVNPYFAARQMERAVPSAKNSVVNWLDLRDEPLAPTIRSALGAQAAGDLTKADLDEVLHDRRINWLGGGAATLAFIALLLLFILRPAQFLSLISRAFAPFTAATIAKQTELVLVHPEHGDITIPVNQSIEFRVLVHGRAPDPSASDAVQLRMKYSPADPAWEERRFEPTARDPREWAVRVPAVAVQNGFIYQVVGGDAATPEYRVSVRSSPLIDGFDVTYRYRPYLRMPEQTAANPNLEALRGTQVTMTVRTNRQVKDGWLRFDKAEDGSEIPSIAAQLVPEQPNALRFAFVLERSARYRVHFQSLEGDANQDPIPYSVKVLTDHAPQVNILRGAPDGLAFDGTLLVEGKASDDFGLTKMRLCGRLFETAGSPRGLPLVDRPFRDGKPFQFANGSYPQALDYKEALPLEQWRLKGPVQTPLRAGMIIEYWLEAEDNCDYPGPNVGKSQPYRVTLGEQPEDQRQAANEQAKADKQNFDRQQDRDWQKENETKAGNAAGAEARDPPQPQPEGGANPAENPQAGGGPNNAEQKAADAKAAEIARQLARKLQQKEQQAQQPKGEAKPDRGASGTNQQQIQQLQRRGNKANAGGANQSKSGGAGASQAQPKGGGANEPQPAGAGAQQQPPAAAGANQQKPDGAGVKQQPGAGGENQPKAGGAGAKQQPQGADSKGQPGAGGENQPKAGGAGAKQQPNGADTKAKPGAGGENQPKAGGAGAKQQPQGADSKGQPGAGGENQPKSGGAGAKQQPQGADAKGQPGAGGENQPKAGGAGAKQQPQGAESKQEPQGDGNQQAQGGDQPQDAGAKGESKSNGGKAAELNPAEAKGDKSNGGAGTDKGQAKNEGNKESAPQPGSAKGNASGQASAGKPDGDGNAQQRQPGAGQGNPAGQDNAGKPDAGSDAKQSQSGSAKGNASGQDQGAKPNVDSDAPQPQPGAAKGDAKGANGQPGQDVAATHPGEAKASGKPDTANPGDAKGAPSGDAAGKPGETKSAPSAKPDSGDAGAGSGDHPAGQPMGKDTKGAGGTSGKGESKGEGTKAGPKGDPNQHKPNAVPDGADSGKPGPPGSTPSGKPDQGAPGDDAVVRPGEGKGIGKPEPAPAKGEAKADADGGRPGSTGAPGELVDAPMGSGPGDKPKSEPRTAGTPGGDARPDAQTGNPKADANEMVKKASDVVKKMTEMAKDGLPAGDEKAVREMAEKARQAAKDHKDLGDALRNADPKLVEELANNLKKLDQQLAKNNSGKPQGDAKPSKEMQEAAKQLAEAMKGAGKPGTSPSPDAQAKGQQPGQGQDTRNGEPSTAGGASGDGSNVTNRPEGEETRVPVGPGETSNPDPRHAARAGEMLLEDFRKKVDRKMLDELKMTQEEYDEFLRAYEAMVQRQKSAAAGNAKDRERGAAKGGSAANSSAKRVEAGTGKTGNLERGGAVLPPPEMRDGYRGFTEDVSKTGTKPKEK